MSFGGATLAPLFVGPSVFLVGTLLAIVVVLVIARVVIGLAWKLVVIGAIVLGVLWLLGAIGVGPPGLG
jgi:membrane-associated phospholipid phosphatase